MRDQLLARAAGRAKAEFALNAFLWLRFIRGAAEPRGVDITPDRHFYEGQFACSKAEVERNLDAKGADWEKTFLIEGFFSDSLTPETRRKYGMKRVALALIDCDLYESTGQVLEFLEPILDDGTVLLFDDWNAFDASDAKGRRRAFREFLEAERWTAEPLLAYGTMAKCSPCGGRSPPLRLSEAVSLSASITAVLRPGRGAGWPGTKGTGCTIRVAVHGGGDGCSATVYDVHDGQFERLSTTSALNSLGNYMPTSPTSAASKHRSMKARSRASSPTGSRVFSICSTPSSRLYAARHALQWYYCTLVGTELGVGIDLLTAR